MLPVIEQFNRAVDSHGPVAKVVADGSAAAMAFWPALAHGLDKVVNPILTTVSVTLGIILVVVRLLDSNMARRLLGRKKDK